LAKVLVEDGQHVFDCGCIYIGFRTR